MASEKLKKFKFFKKKHFKFSGKDNPNKFIKKFNKKSKFANY